MVSTHLKNISQIGSFPQVGMNIKKYLKPPPGNGSIKNVQMTYFTPNKGGKENSKGSLQATIFSTMPTSNVCTIKTFTQQNRPTYLLYIKLCINHLKIQKKQKKTSFWHNLHMNCPKTTGVLTGNASFFSFLLVDPDMIPCSQAYVQPTWWGLPGQRTQISLRPEKQFFSRWFSFF